MDESLNYKVTFDTSELSAKLNEVKQQMDLALGAQSFNNAGMDPYPFSNLFSSPPTTSAGLEMAKEGYNKFTSDMGSLQQMFNNFSETSRLGYSKFTNQLELSGLTSGAAKFTSGANYFGREDALNFLSEKGTFGKGYQALTANAWEPNWSMTQAEFQDISRQGFIQDMLKPSWGNFATSVGVGLMAGGPIGAGVSAVGYGAQSLLHEMSAPYYHNKMVSKYIQSSSRGFLGGSLNSSEADLISDQIARQQFSGKGYNRQELDNVLKEFTQSGGYDHIRSSEEYQRVTSNFFDQHRKVMQTLKLTSEAAAKMMGEVSSNLGVSDFSGFSGQISNYATTTGMSNSAVLNIVSMGAEMSRGSGMDMLSAGLGTASLLQQTKAQAAAGLLSSEDIRQGGGLQNMALTQARGALNYSTSPIGLLNAAATLGGSQGMLSLSGMGIQDRLSAAAGNLSSPGSFLSLAARQNAMRSEMGTQLMNLDQATMFASQANMVMGRPLSGDEFYGFLKQQGMDHTQARMMVATANTGKSQLISQGNSRMGAAIESYLPESRSDFSKFSSNIGNSIDEIFYEAGITSGEITDGLGKAIESIGGGLDQLTGGIFSAGPKKSTVASLFSSSSGQKIIDEALKSGSGKTMGLSGVLSRGTIEDLSEGKLGQITGLFRKGEKLSISDLSKTKEVYAKALSVDSQSPEALTAARVLDKVGSKASMKEKINALKANPEIQRIIKDSNLTYEMLAIRGDSMRDPESYSNITEKLETIGTEVRENLANKFSDISKKLERDLSGVDYSVLSDIAEDAKYEDMGNFVLEMTTQGSEEAAIEFARKRGVAITDKRKGIIGRLFNTDTHSGQLAQSAAGELKQAIADAGASFEGVMDYIGFGNLFSGGAVGKENEKTRAAAEYADRLKGMVTSKYTGGMLSEQESSAKLLMSMTELVDLFKVVYADKLEDSNEWRAQQAMRDKVREIMY
jgi:hypothetical protein